MHRRASLIEMLSQFTPTGPREAEHLDRMMRLVGTTGNPFLRSHFVPGHFTASAFVLSPDRSSLLLIMHAKLHRWLQPGGHVEPEDADLIAAARRELVEEVGRHALPGPLSPWESDGARASFFPIFDLDIHPIPAMKGEPAHEHFDVRFLFHAPDHAFTAGSDAKSAKWVPLADITAEMTDASVMRAIGKLK